MPGCGVMEITELPIEVLVLIYELYPFREDIVDKWRQLMGRKLNFDSYYRRRDIFYDRVFVNMLRYYNGEMERFVFY